MICGGGLVDAEGVLERRRQAGSGGESAWPTTTACDVLEAFRQAPGAVNVKVPLASVVTMHVVRAREAAAARRRRPA